MTFKLWSQTDMYKRINPWLPIYRKQKKTYSVCTRNHKCAIDYTMTNEWFGAQSADIIFTSRVEILFRCIKYAQQTV